MKNAAHRPLAPAVPLLGAHAETVYDSLVAQTRAAVSEAGFAQVVLGLSGGIDSALLATIAVDALAGNAEEARVAKEAGECVHAVMMPSALTSAESLRDAALVARRLGVKMLTLPITDAYKALRDTLVPTFGAAPVDVTEENLQARVRGVLLMALSNKFGWLVLAPCNMSELYTGYTTLYGDMVGAFAPLAPLLKTWVYELAHLRNARALAAGEEPPIPEAVFAKEPSAELAANQRDSDTLGSYDELDALLYYYCIIGRTAQELCDCGFDSAYVNVTVQRIRTSAFKRRMACPGAVLDDTITDIITGL